MSFLDHTTSKTSMSIYYRGLTGKSTSLMNKDSEFYCFFIFEFIFFLRLVKFEKKICCAKVY